ncbi:MAG TPA: carbohydrate kinase family protein [Candidatus Limnocylindria bacterium]
MRLWAKAVGIVSRVGSDYPADCLDALADAGIDTSGIRRVNDEHALLSGYQYDQQGHRRQVDPSSRLPLSEPTVGKEWAEQSSMIRVPESVRELFDPRFDDVPASFRSARGFHIANMGYPAQRAYVDSLQGKLLSLDATDPDLPLELHTKLLGAVDLFLPSEIQAKGLLTGAKEDWPHALARLAELGPWIVAVKVGSEGSWVHDSKAGRSWHIPVVPLAQVKDPTGAGDAYCGGFLAAVIDGHDALESGLRATVSASFVIEAFDARHGLQVSRDEAESRLVPLRRLVSEAGRNSQLN